MPTFIPKNHGPVVAEGSPLDLPLALRSSYDRGTSRPGSMTYFSYASSKKSLDGIDSSLSRSDVRSPAGGRVNGDTPHDVSLTSLPNGRPSGSSSREKSTPYLERMSSRESSAACDDPKKSLPNGLPIIVNGDRPEWSAEDSMQHTPVDKVSTSAGLISGLPRATAEPVTSDSKQPQRALTSQHRFSSPPACTNTNTSASSTSLHPGASTLKHRHTLQVPRVGVARSSTSRDDEPGRERALSTGFTPAGRTSLNLHRRPTASTYTHMATDTAPPDEDALRWAEAVRQKRQSKRKRKDDEDDDRVVVGTKVDQHHVNWVTAYNMLTGIRFTVSRTNAKLDRELTDADFDAAHKHSFDM